MLNKFGGGANTVFLKRFQITEAVVFVKESILIMSAFFGSSTGQAALGNEFDINLYPLT